MKFALFKKLLPEWGLFFLLGMGIFALTRGFLLLKHTDAALRSRFHADLAPMWIKGTLFDVKVLSVILAACVLAALSALCRRAWMERFYRSHFRVLAGLLTVLAGMNAADVFYFATYGRSFDVFVFGLWDEDTAAVLQTVWSDYPVLRGAAALALFAWAANGLFGAVHRRYAARAPLPVPLRQSVALVLLTVLALAAGIRGSFGKFPLRQSAAQVSPAEVLNRLVPNAAVSLQWAAAEYRAGKQFHAVGDDEGIKLFAAMLRRPVGNADLTQLQSPPPPFQAALPPPNVVLVLMESMSSHMLQSDDARQRDLLGALRPHFAEDWVYRRFVSEGDGTSDTLHRLLVRSPFNNVSQTAAKNKTFTTNLFKPYSDAGYRVVYITAGNGGWRDFNRFINHLGAHEFVDETELRRLYPEARAGAWGVPDEFMFRYAAERIARAEREKQPVFVMLLSVTNHPPYRLPDTAVRRDFVFSENEKARFAGMGDVRQINEVFNTFRYANDALGRFLDAVKPSGQTIVAATGDHNLRGIGYPDAAEAVLGHAVPFYLHVPPAYRQGTAYVPERVGSHKDIMPTLYELSLPQRVYLRTGCNLAAADPSGNPWCGYGYNQSVLLLPEGGVDLHNGRFHAWDDAGKLLLSPQPSPLPETARTAAESGKHYGAFLHWLINRMVNPNTQQ